MFCFIRGDERRYQQILVNFLSNALKFSSPDSMIKIKLQVLEIKQNIKNQGIKSEESQKEDAEGEECYISFNITVKDYGMGIPADKLNHLFLNFSKIEENAEVNKSGVGLGLSICKNLIEQMGGSVQVESIVKKFTKFHIRMNTICKLKDFEAIKDLVPEDPVISEKSQI